MNQFDVIVIGSGPGGGTVARGLSSHGKKVALVEKDKWGGTCPNYGCDPTKIMMSAVETKLKASHMQIAGIKGELEIDWGQLMKRKRAYTDPFSEESKKGLGESGVRTLTGEARFTPSQDLEVAGDIYQADRYVIATGQRASIPDIEGREYLKTSNDFLALDRLPDHLVFLGTGFVALELAQIARAAGSRVTLLARGPLKINGFDPDLSSEYLAQLQAEGIEFVDHFQTVSVNHQEGEGYQLTDENGRTLVADYVVAAVGREPAIHSLDLDNLGVAIGPKGIQVDAYLQTSNPKVYALGDVIDKPQGKLTPVSSFEGQYLVEQFVTDHPQPIQYPVIPTIIFGSTKLAKIGLQEGEVRILDMTSWYAYRRVADPRAKTKVFVNEAQEIVGATVLSTLADEVINLLSFVINKKIQLSEAENLIMAYPTPASDLPYFY